MHRRPVSAPDSAYPRGTAFQVGSLGGARSISAEGELLATTARLRGASESHGGLGELRTAIACADELLARLPAALAGTYDAEVLRRLAAEARVRVDSDADLSRDAALWRSKPVRAEVRRLWDLMIAESKRIAQEGGQQLPEDAVEVTRAGYRRMHSCVAVTLINGGGQLSSQYRAALADREWAEDVERYVGTSHILVFLEQIKTRFQAAATDSVAVHGFKTLFARYDVDRSGELDIHEFTAAIRTDLAIDSRTLSDDELFGLFGAVDVDGGGSISIDELMDWLFSTRTAATRPSAPVWSRLSPAKNDIAPSPKAKASTARVKSRFKLASAAMCEEIGWRYVFDKYDSDGNGELDIHEFTSAVREECHLPPTIVSDSEMAEIFRVVDADQSGTIDSKELRALLHADLGATSLTFRAFNESLLELVGVWSEEPTPEQYVIFLKALFAAISQPMNGHTANENLEDVPVFDDGDLESPNFLLRETDKCCKLVHSDRLHISGFKSASPVTQDDSSTVGAQGLGGVRKYTRRRRRKANNQVSNRLMDSTTASRMRQGQQAPQPRWETLERWSTVSVDKLHARRLPAGSVRSFPNMDKLHAAKSPLGSGTLCWQHRANQLQRLRSANSYSRKVFAAGASGASTPTVEVNAPLNDAAAPFNGQRLFQLSPSFPRVQILNQAPLSPTGRNLGYLLSPGGAISPPGSIAAAAGVLDSEMLMLTCAQQQQQRRIMRKHSDLHDFKTRVVRRRRPLHPRHSGYP